MIYVFEFEDGKRTYVASLNKISFREPAPKVSSTAKLQSPMPPREASAAPVNKAMDPWPPRITCAEHGARFRITYRGSKLPGPVVREIDVLASSSEEAAASFKQFSPNLEVMRVVRLPPSVRDYLHRTKESVLNAIALTILVAVYGGAIVVMFTGLFK
jgi:hypothetical protein